MEIRAIHNEPQYEAALVEIDRLLAFPEGSAEEDRLEVLSILVEAYESETHERIPNATPVEIIRFVMEQQGLTRADLEPMIGARGRVSEVLSGKRPLSLTMMRALSRGLRIPLGALAEEYDIKPAKRVAKQTGKRAWTAKPARAKRASSD